MAYQAIPPTSGGGNSPDQVALTRARQLLGTSITKVLGSDFDNDQWYRSVIVSTGTLAQSTTERGGVIVLSSSAAANSFAVLYPHGTTTIQIDNPQTQKWYVRSRQKCTTAVDAAALLYMGFATAGGAGPLLDFGLLGNLSTAFFSGSVTNNAGAVQASFTSTVAYDTTAYHLFEAWSNATTISFAIDGATVSTTAATNVGTNPVTPTVVSGNGATAANRVIQCDYIYCCVGDP